MLPQPITATFYKLFSIKLNIFKYLILKLLDGNKNLIHNKKLYKTTIQIKFKHKNII